MFSYTFINSHSQVSDRGPLVYLFFVVGGGGGGGSV